MTVADIPRVSREYLRPQALSIVLVGEARTFLNELSRVGFDDYEVLSVADLETWEPSPPSAAGVAAAP